MQAALITSVLTGVFCAVFAVGVNFVTSALSLLGVVGVAFASGFCGSLFAQLVLGRTK